MNLESSQPMYDQLEVLFKIHDGKSYSGIETYFSCFCGYVFCFCFLGVFFVVFLFLLLLLLLFCCVFCCCFFLGGGVIC